MHDFALINAPTRTYWDYTQLRFPRREGMRIDFVLGSPALAARVGQRSPHHNLHLFRQEPHHGNQRDPLQSDWIGRAEYVHPRGRPGLHAAAAMIFRRGGRSCAPSRSRP